MLRNLILNILNVYTPNGNPIENTEKFNFKNSWLREIIKLSSNIIACNKNLLIAGDFNVLEETSDVKNFEN